MDNTFGTAGNKLSSIERCYCCQIKVMFYVNKQVKVTKSDQSHKYYEEYKTESGTNTDPWLHHRWSKHPLLADITRRESYILNR